MKDITVPVGTSRNLNDIFIELIKDGLTENGIVVHEDMPGPTWIFDIKDDGTDVARLATSSAITEITKDNIEDTINVLSDECNKKTGHFSLYKLDDRRFVGLGEDNKTVWQKIKYATW
jgi:hypothetical protein